ncbi:integrase domain protein [Brucella grignonensis]|uniref:Integrase domain protein n=1 Tax=Brucella grignonensis TaxID=94627 RepID=A0A256EYU9_9HYPH|nr:integrase domain protein [Brucella grignonensis]
MAIGSGLPWREGLAKKEFGGDQITIFAEKEFSCIPVTINGAIQVQSIASDFDIGFIKIPFTRNLTLLPTKQLKALKFKTPYEAIQELWKSKPEVFIVKPHHHMMVPDN